MSNGVNVTLRALFTYSPGQLRIGNFVIVKRPNICSFRIRVKRLGVGYFDDGPDPDGVPAVGQIEILLGGVSG
jgi:hypothetical protein